MCSTAGKHIFGTTRGTSYEPPDQSMDVRCAPLPLSCRQVGIARHEGCGAGAPCPAWRAGHAKIYSTRRVLHISLCGVRGFRLPYARHHVSSFADDHDGYIYIFWLRIPYNLLSAPPALCHVRPPPLGREPSTARSHQTQPTSGAQIGVSSREPRTGGHHAGARRRRTAASSGRPAARHKATKPPPRAHLANELGSLQRAPCFSSSLPRRLSADGGATRPFRRPRHTPKRASARLGSCRRWHCTGRWHCSPLALH